MGEKVDGGLVVVRAGEASEDTGQSPGALRLAGIDAVTAGARQLWLGRVSNEPGARSVPHHHGRSETAGYILSGRCRIYYGENYAQHVDLEKGDFVYVPPFFPHIEANLSDSEPLEFVTARSPENEVHNLDEPEGLAG